MGTSSPRGTSSPANVGSRSTSVENLSHSPARSTTPELQENLLFQSQSSLDNVSIDSQSSTGFIIPLSSPDRTPTSSPLPFLARSPGDQILFAGGGSRPQTPLSFSEESVEKSKSQFQTSSVPSKRISAVPNFSKLFPHRHGPRSGFTELKEKACEYCLRLIEQSERSK